MTLLDDRHDTYKTEDLKPRRCVQARGALRSKSRRRPPHSLGDVPSREATPKPGTETGLLPRDSSNKISDRGRVDRDESTRSPKRVVIAEGKLVGNAIDQPRYDVRQEIV